jgi:predicted amidohydrolase YtcJ
MTEQILVAKSFITMNPNLPRASAVAIKDGLIVAVGTVAACKEVLPNAPLTDLGDSVMLPGFVEPHSHLFMSGMSTMSPAVYIAPWLYPTWDSIVALAKKMNAEMPAGQAITMYGLDDLLHGVPMPTIEQMDDMFGDRPAGIINLSGHGLSFGTAVIKALGWDKTPPENPAGGHYMRNADGSLTGVAMEPAAFLPIAAYLVSKADAHPLLQGAEWYRYMAQYGITSSGDMMYTPELNAGMTALAEMPNCPLRVTLYHSSTDPDCGKPFTSSADKSMLDMRGVKLWADGSPWMGNIAISYQYLDNAVTREAGFPLNPGMSGMNWTREQIDAFIDANAPLGWQISCHANGDLAIDTVLDAYEAALKKFNLLGTDHRWRMEHLGGARADQFVRMAALGVEASVGMFQMLQWGDLLDGTLFETEIGSQWSRCGDASIAGARVSFHNDGNVSRPWPLANVMGGVARVSISGKSHGPEQAISMTEALRAVTINPAMTLRRDTEVGSLEVGKFADFVELSADPYEVDPVHLIDEVTVRGTWMAGGRIDLDAFIATVSAVDPSIHRAALTKPKKPTCC